MPNLIKIIAASPVTNVLVLINITVSGIAFADRDRYFRWILHPFSIIKNKEYFRVISSGFVHNDFKHLLVNSAMIALICGELESYLREHYILGSYLFLAIYLISHAFGAAVVVWSNRGNFEYSSAGASGSILGCIMGFTIIAPFDVAFYLPVLGPVQNQFAALIVILGLIVYKWRTGNEMIDHELHFFSALGGIATTCVLIPGIL